MYSSTCWNVWPGLSAYENVKRWPAANCGRRSLSHPVRLVPKSSSQLLLPLFVQVATGMTLLMRFGGHDCAVTAPSGAVTSTTDSQDPVVQPTSFQPAISLRASMLSPPMLFHSHGPRKACVLVMPVQVRSVPTTTRCPATNRSSWTRPIAPPLAQPRPSHRPTQLAPARSSLLMS